MDLSLALIFLRLPMYFPVKLAADEPIQLENIKNIYQAPDHPKQYIRMSAGQWLLM